MNRGLLGKKEKKRPAGSEKNKEKLPFAAKKKTARKREGYKKRRKKENRILGIKGRKKNLLQTERHEARVEGEENPRK